ncbi:MAG: TfoX/Sxy family protein [Candidatus Fimenecus sp.]
MATNLEFAQYVCEQIAPCGCVRYRKMFGEYMVYVNDKPLFMVCDNIVFVKQLEVLSDLLGENEIGMPYAGAKPHYIIDADDREQLQAVVNLLEPLTALPKKRRKKS